MALTEIPIELSSTPGIVDNSNATAITIDASENVGIGTSSPATGLHLSGSDNVSSSLTLTNTAPAPDNTWTFVPQYNSLDLAVLNNGVERMRIDSSGNLLVGTTSNSVYNDASGTGIALNAGQIQIAGTGTPLYANRQGSDGDIIDFRKDGAPVGSIGSVAGVSTYIHGGTGYSGLTFGNDELLPCNESGDTRDAAIDLGDAGGRFKDLYLSGQWVSNGANNTLRASFQVSGTQYGYINVATTGTLYSTSSDYRLKENVIPLTNATARLKQLNPLRFSFIPDETNTIVDGFLAHEVQDVVPEAIAGTKDAMRDEEYEVTPAVLDDDGNVITEAVMGTRSVPDYQGIDQSKLVPLLVATIQELEARIAALES